VDVTQIFEDFNPLSEAQQAYVTLIEEWRESGLHPIITDEAADILSLELLSPAAPGPDVLARAALALQMLSAERTALRRWYVAETGQDWPESPETDPENRARTAATLREMGVL
jgi:hypothetical protein